MIQSESTFSIQNLAGEAQKEVLKENFYNELLVQEEIRRRQKALEVADDRLKFQVISINRYSISL